MPNLDKIDPTFVADLLGSHEAVERLAHYLRLQGYRVTLPAIRVRPTVEQRRAYGDEGDLLLQSPVEVKRLNADFVDCASFHYPLILLARTYLWDRAQPKPLAYYVLNQSMTVAAKVASETRPHWRIVDRQICGRAYTLYACPKELATYERLVEGLD